MIRKECISLVIASTVVVMQYVDAATLYQYDTQHRLTKVIYDNDTVIKYAYDASGNWTSRVVFQTAPMDFDTDNDVDQHDFEAFQACASGPAIPLSTGCESADLDHDGDVDQSDFGIFQRCYSGADNPADPNCAN